MERGVVHIYFCFIYNVGEQVWLEIKRVNLGNFSKHWILMVGLLTDVLPETWA